MQDIILTRDKALRSFASSIIVSHTGFPLVPQVVTLHHLKRRIMAVILRYFTEFGSSASSEFYTYSR